MNCVVQFSNKAMVYRTAFLASLAVLGVLPFSFSFADALEFPHHGDKHGCNTSTSAVAAINAGATTTPGLGVLSEFNTLSIIGSCIVATSTNQKRCDMFVTYKTSLGNPVIGIPVTLATLNGKGTFINVIGPLLISNGPGKVVQYSGILPGTAATNAATLIESADATSTLFIALTPDGLRAQDTFASSTTIVSVFPPAGDGIRHCKKPHRQKGDRDEKNENKKSDDGA